MMARKKKKKIIEEFKIHPKDTGSAQVQIALLSERIKSLSLHLKKHPKDIHSRRGLLKLISKRRKLLSYLEKEDRKSYLNLIKKLSLKKKK